MGLSRSNLVNMGYKNESFCGTKQTMNHLLEYPKCSIQILYIDELFSLSDEAMELANQILEKMDEKSARIQKEKIIT